MLLTVTKLNISIPVKAIVDKPSPLYPWGLSLIPSSYSLSIPVKAIVDKPSPLYPWGLSL